MIIPHVTNILHGSAQMFASGSGLRKLVHDIEIASFQLGNMTENISGVSSTFVSPPVSWFGTF